MFIFFFCVVKFYSRCFVLRKRTNRDKKIKKLLAPNQKKYSALLKSIPSEYLAFVSELKNKVAYKQSLLSSSLMTRNANLEKKKTS